MADRTKPPHGTRPNPEYELQDEADRELFQKYAPLAISSQLMPDFEKLDEHLRILEALPHPGKDALQ